MRLIKKIVRLRYEKLNDSNLANILCMLTGMKNLSTWNVTANGKIYHIKKIDWNRFLVEKDNKKYFIVILSNNEMILRVVRNEVW